jgi:hypothetical protein
VLLHPSYVCVSNPEGPHSAAQRGYISTSAMMGILAANYRKSFYKPEHILTPFDVYTSS